MIRSFATITLLIASLVNAKADAPKLNQDTINYLRSTMKPEWFCEKKDSSFNGLRNNNYIPLAVFSDAFTHIKRTYVVDKPSGVEFEIKTVYDNDDKNIIRQCIDGVGMVLFNRTFLNNK